MEHHFHGGHAAQLQCFKDGHAVIGVAARIDDDAVGAARRRLDLVDDVALVVRLEEVRLDAHLLTADVQIIQQGVVIDLALHAGFGEPGHVDVGAVNERAALGFHFLQRVGAAGERTPAAHRKVFQRAVDEEHHAVLAQSPQIFGPLDDAAPAGEHLTALLGKAGGLLRFLGAEPVLALGGEDVRDAAALGLDDFLVEVHEPLAQFLGQCAADGGLAGGGHPDEGHVQLLSAERRRDGADLAGGIQGRPQPPARPLPRRGG